MTDRFKHFDYPKWTEEELAVFEPAGFKHVKYPEPKQKPLTDEEIDDIFYDRLEDVPGQTHRLLARAIERAHGIGEKK